MKAYGDIERVNLATGERFRRVSGDGESILESVGARPLNDPERKAIEEAIADSMRRIRQHEKEMIEAPRRNFTAAAIAAGFTEAQAEFLWDNRPRPEWKA